MTADRSYVIAREYLSLTAIHRKLILSLFSKTAAGPSLSPELEDSVIFAMAVKLFEAMGITGPMYDIAKMYV